MARFVTNVYQSELDAAYPFVVGVWLDPVELGMAVEFHESAPDEVVERYVAAVAQLDLVEVVLQDALVRRP